jgi:hypothetical protein
LLAASLAASPDPEASCDLCLSRRDTDLKTVATASWSLTAVGELKQSQTILSVFFKFCHFLKIFAANTL